MTQRNISLDMTGSVILLKVPQRTLHPPRGEVRWAANASVTIQLLCSLSVAFKARGDGCTSGGAAGSWEQVHHVGCFQIPACLPREIEVGGKAHSSTPCRLCGQHAPSPWGRQRWRKQNTLIEGV